MNCDIVCFSHLRWDFVFQRPQHILKRFSKKSRVFFIEEPIWDTGKTGFEEKEVAPNIIVATPHFTITGPAEAVINRKRAMIDELLLRYNVDHFISWYYAPMAFAYSNHLRPSLIVYDCMDELAAFKNPPAKLRENEALLIQAADVMFTGGHSLYNAKKHLHPYCFPFPSSIDRHHFFTARGKQANHIYENIPGPRLGFYGVIDERFNTELLASLAAKHTDWSFIMVGPIAKISREELPALPNIYYTGMVSYEALPGYLCGWDIAIMPFARNEATRFISPTKTPEFLAAGKPVISTAITDVVDPYGTNELVWIADDAAAFSKAADHIFSNVINNGANYARWLGRVDNFMHGMSWDNTCAAMEQIVEVKLKEQFINLNKQQQYV